MPSCPGALVLHVLDRAVAGCTYDDEAEGCAGRDERAEGDPTDCVPEWGGCVQVVDRPLLGIVSMLVKESC